MKLLNLWPWIHTDFLKHIQVNMRCWEKILVCELCFGVIKSILGVLGLRTDFHFSPVLKCFHALGQEKIIISQCSICDLSFSTIRSCMIGFAATQLLILMSYPSHRPFFFWRLVPSSKSEKLPSSYDLQKMLKSQAALKFHCFQ